MTARHGTDLVVPLECPNCGHETSLNARTTAPGTVVKCACGAELEITGDDLRKIQASIDDLMKTISRLGR